MPAKTRSMPRKKRPEPLRRTKGFRIMLTSAEKEEISDAAQRAGIDAASWARLVLLREARKEADGGKSTGD